MEGRDVDDGGMDGVDVDEDEDEDESGDEDVRVGGVDVSGVEGESVEGVAAGCGTWRKALWL